MALHPESVADPVAFLGFAESVAKLTTPPIVKWIFFVDSTVVPSDFPPDHPVLPLQRWEASNQEVRQDVADQLEQPQIPPAERLKLTSMAAGFAAGEGDLESSELLHRQTIELARQQNDVPGEATAHYHVGNALMAQQQFETAEGHLSQCVILAVECEMHSLVGMAMTHLGVCLDQLDRRDESADAFDAAASTFDGIGDVPAHARVFDVRALQSITKDEVPQAQAHWQKSLALFESIQPGPLDPVRESGIEEIREKLDQHCGGQTTENSSQEND